MAHQITAISQEDIISWPDGTWCYRENLHEFAWMSDDYITLAAGSAEHAAFLATQEA